MLIEGDDILGDGVNIAARLEGICEPGGVLISGAAYDHVRGRIDADFVDLGEKDAQEHRAAGAGLRAWGRRDRSGERLDAAKARRPGKTFSAGAVGDRGLAHRDCGWRVVLVRRQPACRRRDRPAAPVASNAAAPAEAAHLSIVVLPFTNLSGDPAQDYFADGITENLTTDLSRIRNSFVIARNTAFTYKGKTVDAKEIGKELGVRYVLEGSVQRDQNRVRVNAQLIDAETGAHLWADRFEEDVADLFKLQDQVVARLANTLGHRTRQGGSGKGRAFQEPRRRRSHHARLGLVASCNR